MHMRNILLFTIALIGMCPPVFAQQQSQVSVLRDGAALWLTVAGSGLQMSFPAGSFERNAVNFGGSTESPRYFIISDPAQKITMSGWFEPASRYRGAATIWEQDLAAATKGGVPVPVDVSFKKLGAWDAVIYRQPTSAEASTWHVRAHLVESGTWIDLHISSFATDASNNPAVVEAMLQSIAISRVPAHRALLAILNIPRNQWVLNHLCVPLRDLGKSDFRNRDFVDAYLAINKSRWEEILDTKRRGDSDSSLKGVGRLVHSIIDSYWPARLERNPAGAITRIRDCDELGGFEGVLREEKAGPGPSGESEAKVKDALAQIFLGWKEGWPFDKIAPILQGGAMKFAEEQLSASLGRAK